MLDPSPMTFINFSRRPPLPNVNNDRHSFSSFVVVPLFFGPLTFAVQIDEAISYCEQTKDPPNAPLPRAILLLALAKSFKARQTSIHRDRQTLFRSAVKDLEQFVSRSYVCCSSSSSPLRSIQLDPYDSIAHFHLAHNFAFLNEVSVVVVVVSSVTAFLLPDSSGDQGHRTMSLSVS